MPNHFYRVDRYLLDDQHNPVLCEDIKEWTTWMMGSRRLVQDTQLLDRAHRPVRISSVFLGIDVNFGDAKPVLFETMVLGGAYDREVYRYHTWDEAKHGHAAIVQRCSGEELTATAFLPEARGVARDTLKKAAERGVTYLLEEAFAGYMKQESES